MDLYELNLAPEIVNAIIHSLKITTVEELREIPEKTLTSIHLLGPKRVQLIKTALGEAAPVGKDKRSLYQCFNAKVGVEKVYCSKGHEFPHNLFRPLQRGAPLVISCCQECQDYDEMGPPVEKADRGWVTIKKGA